MRINVFYIWFIALAIGSAGITYVVLWLPFQVHGEDPAQNAPVAEQGSVLNVSTVGVVDTSTTTVALVDDSSEGPSFEYAVEESSTTTLPVIHKTATQKSKISNSSDKIPPSIPQSISAYAVSPSQVNISWHVAYDNVGVVGYYIYRDGLLIGDVAGLKYASVNLIHETKYRFEVAAYDAAGNISGRSYVYEVFTPTFPAKKATTTDEGQTTTQVAQQTAQTTPTPAVTTPTITPSTTGVNKAPVIVAGSAKTVTLPVAVSLSLAVSDDALPAGATLSYIWSKSLGPGTVTFANANSLSTTATFSAAGTYSLCLTVSDTALISTSCVNVTVSAAAAGTTYSVTVTSGGTISPSSLAIHAGDTVSFNFSGNGDEVILSFSPSLGTTIKLDHDTTKKSFKFTNTGTYSYHRKDGGGTNATITVQ